jgi:hypothetical protein
MMRILPVVVVAFLSAQNHVDAFQNSPLPILQKRSSTTRTRTTTRLYDWKPQLSNWKVLPEGKIRGVISGHPVIPDGDTVTTSPILDPESATTDKLVNTNSGSQYVLKNPQGTQVVQKLRGTRQIKGTQKIGNKAVTPKTPSSLTGASAVAVVGSL